jgi:hypothetical protein
MILRVAAWSVAVILSVWAALILSATSGETPDGSPAHPFPPVMATPGKAGPR